MSCAPKTAPRTTRAARRRVPVAPTTRFAPIYVHEDEPPEIAPIPIKFDDEDEAKPQEIPKPKQKRLGTKLDQLPHIYHSPKLNQFSTHSKSIAEKKPRDLNRSSSVKIFTESTKDSRILLLKVPKYPSLDCIQRIIKRKVTEYVYKSGRSKFKMYGNEITVTRSSADTQAAKSRKESQEPITSSMAELVKPIEWFNSFDLSEEVTSRMIATGKDAKVKNAKKPAVARAIGITSSQMQKFDFLKIDPEVLKLSRRAIVPDLWKMLALSAWQKGDLRQCIYYLSEAQFHFNRRDIVDKHASHFVRKKDRPRLKSPNTLLDEKKDLLYGSLSSELKYASKTQSDFEETIQKLNPDWNVVQFTKMFYYKNRFGNDLANSVETPAMFITALVNVNGTRCPCVTYQPPPKENPGLTKFGILEDMKHILIHNRSLNNNYKGTRSQYWENRTRHNNQLKTLLSTIEETWIFPWDFLLPGNIRDRKIVKSIMLLLTSLQATHGTFTPQIKGLLYKLIENYNMIHPDLRHNLPRFLASIIQLPEESLKSIANAIKKCGTEIEAGLPRFPTILVVDQGFEIIPWESIRCLTYTSVTRVPSIPLIHGLTVMQKMKKDNYGETVNGKSLGYILNPDGTLKGVEERLHGYLSGNQQWTGIVHQKPKAEEITSFFEMKDIYLYCGHGNGSVYLPEHRINRLICRAIPIMMGCASLRYKHYGTRSVSTSITNALFSSTCVSAVGFLYEITDLECDRLTIELLERWAPGARKKLPGIYQFDTNTPRPKEKCLATAVRLSRPAAVQFMTSASLVYYGIPSITN